MNLRPYQLNCVQAVESGWAQFRRQLIVCPTGSGKTVIFSHLAARQPGRTLILAHREELIDQAIDKLHVATGIIAGKEKAKCVAGISVKVVVASVQTMIRRLDRWPKDHFALVVADEAHHAISDSWQAVLGHFNVRVLGVTATPDRGDRRNLGAYFENVAAEVKLLDLINDGYLSRITVKSVPLQIDLSKVKSTAGDLDAGELGHALEPYLGAIAGAIKEHASFRRVLAFLPLIATSHKFVEACQSAGLSAGHIDGESPDRREILARFARWEFDVLSNAMLLTEGFDDPGIDCIVCLRPTRSRPLFAQMVGRGTRIQDVKENLLLLDFLWLHERHSITRPAHLVAGSEAEAEAITELAQEKAASGATQDELELEGLMSEASAKREDNLRKQLATAAGRKAKFISAEEFAVNHHSLAVAEYEPTMRWESEPITEKQAKYLKQARIDPESVKGRGHASKLLDLHFKDRKLVLASPKQQSLMRRMGHPSPATATSDEARRFFAGMRK